MPRKYTEEEKAQKLEDIKVLVRPNNIEILSDKYVNAKTPLNPDAPEEPQTKVLPLSSVMVTNVLLNEAEM